MVPTTFGGQSFRKGKFVQDDRGNKQRPYERTADSYQYDPDEDKWTVMTPSVSNYKGENPYPYRARLGAAVFQMPRNYFPDCQ